MAIPGELYTVHSLDSMLLNETVEHISGGNRPMDSRQYRKPTPSMETQWRSNISEIRTG